MGCCCLCRRHGGGTAFAAEPKFVLFPHRQNKLFPVDRRMGGTRSGGHCSEIKGTGCQGQSLWGGGGRSWPLPGDGDEWVGSPLRGAEGQRPSSSVCVCVGVQKSLPLWDYPTLSEGQEVHGASGILMTTGRPCRMQRTGWSPPVSPPQLCWFLKQDPESV